MPLRVSPFQYCRSAKCMVRRRGTLAEPSIGSYRFFHTSVRGESIKQVKYIGTTRFDVRYKSAVYLGLSLSQPVLIRVSLTSINILCYIMCNTCILSESEAEPPPLSSLNTGTTWRMTRNRLLRATHQVALRLSAP